MFWRIYTLFWFQREPKKINTRESPRLAFRHALESQSRSRIAFRLIQVFRSGGCRLSMTWHGPETPESSGMDSTGSFNGKTGGALVKTRSFFVRDHVRDQERTFNMLPKPLPTCCHAVSWLSVPRILIVINLSHDTNLVPRGLEHKAHCLLEV